MEDILFICYFVFIQAAAADNSTSAVIIEFIAQPDPAAIVLGNDLTLNCLAKVSTTLEPTTEETIQYQWLFNNEDIATSLSKALQFQNHSLFVPRVRRTDLGQYECIVWLEYSPQEVQRSGAVTVLETYLEEFYSSPESDELFENNRTLLECVTGYAAPPALLHWEKDGTIFHHGTQEVARFGVVGPGGAVQQTISLEFTVWIEYNGTYRCVARNPLNNQTRVSQPAYIKVQAPRRLPYITRVLPQQLLLTEGAPYMFLTPIRGWPLPHIIWYRDGKMIRNSDRIYIVENGSLIFDPVLREDVARYACIGSNVLGSVATLSTNLSVGYLDGNFREQPQNLSVVAGQSTKLPCQPPDSYPEVSIIWYRNTQPMSMRTGLYAVSIDRDNSLVFDNIQMNDSGTYYCVAYNHFAIPESRTTNGAVLSMEGSPQIHEPPTDTGVLKGDLLTLLCQVRGYPKPTIAWYKGDELLLPDSRIIIRDWGQILLVADTNRPDEGHYRCIADNIHGRASSHLAFVDVIVPPEITAVMSDLTVADRQNAVFSCRYYGDPVPTISWFKDGNQIIPEAGSGVLQTVDGLDIVMATKEDEGHYICRGENTGGQKQQEAQLYVQVPPQFVAYPGDKLVNVSQAVLLYCEAIGDPQPSITWRVNGSNILPPGVSVSDDISTLIIQSALLSHSGNYTCVAENVQGQLERTGVLFVQEKPTIDKISGSTTINQGSVLGLRCEVKGQPPPSVVWYHNGRVINVMVDPRMSLQEEGRRLVVQYVSSSDSGDYQCTASNPAGSDTSTIQTFIRETPFPPFLDRTRPVSKSSINITWIPVPQNFYTQLLYYVVQYKSIKLDIFTTFRDDIFSNITYIEVDGLDSAAEYVFQVAGRNIVGIGDYSRVIGTKTLESAPGPVRNLQLVSQTGTSVMLRWEIPERSNGEIHSYQLQHKQQSSAKDYISKTIESPSLPLQTYTLGELIPYTTYLVRVRAANLEQETTLQGDFTKPLTITTAMQAPSSPPSNVLLTALSSSSIKIQWQPVPVEFQNGALQGYIVYYRSADTSQPITEQRTDPTLRETVITSLLPWRYYQISMAAYNAAGVGVESESQRVRTHPEAPKGFPQDVKTEVMSSISAKISWKELSLADRQSEISGYLVWYRDERSNETSSQYVPGPNILNTVLSDLVPWTVYKIQVQAFTTQLENGFGPLGIEQRMKTDQDVPDMVSNLEVIVNADGVILSWQQPTRPNGIITGYLILVDGGHLVNVVSRKRRSIIHYKPDDVGPAIQQFDLSASDTSVTIDNLSPEMNYKLALAARTIIGHGLFDNTTITTPAVTETPILVTSGPPMDITSIMVDIPVTEEDLERDVLPVTTPVPPPDGSMSQKEVIGIVVGSVIGGLLVLLLLILIIVICCRRINQADDSYIYSDYSNTTTGSSGTDADSNHHRAKRQQFCNIRLPENAPYTTSNTEYPQTSSTASRTKRPVARPPGGRGHTATHSVVKPDTQIRPNMDRSEVFAITQPPMHAPFSNDSVPSPTEASQYAYGYDNPGYLEENNLNKGPSTSRGRNGTRHPTQNVSSNVGPIRDVRTRRSKHMQSSTAAAIAAQKHRESSIFHDMPDTDNLIDDSVIIYNERTAL